MNHQRTDWASIAIVLVAMTFAAYFCFSAVQGELGILRRAEYQAEAASLRAELDDLTQQIAQMENKTHRLSDGYLDLDLLDERVRDVLGRVHKDDLVLQ